MENIKEINLKELVKEAESQVLTELKMKIKKEVETFYRKVTACEQAIKDTKKKLQSLESEKGFLVKQVAGLKSGDWSLLPEKKILGDSKSESNFSKEITEE